MDLNGLLSLLGLPSRPGEMISAPLMLEATSKLKRGGRGLRLVIPGPQGDWGEIHLDRLLMKAVARGRAWYDMLVSGQATSQEELRKANGISAQQIARFLPCAWLAPDIVEAILGGQQPKELTVARLLKKFPLDWVAQRRVLGFESVNQGR